MATNTAMDAGLVAEVRGAFIKWIQERRGEGEQLLLEQLGASPRYYFFEQNTSQYATEFFSRIDRWRRWLLTLITGLRRRVLHADHLVEDASTRFAEARLLVFTIRDFNDPTLSKTFDLRDRASVSNGAGWIDIRQWFGRGREEPAWDQVRQSMLVEVRTFEAMLLEQVNELQLINVETGTESAATSAAVSSSSAIDQTSRFTGLEPRGEGAHASVWRALDTKLNRIVALRVVQPSAGGDQEAIAHARTMAKPPQHQNIVTVYELVLIAHPNDRRPVIAAVMEFIDGDKLSSVTKRQLSGSDALRLCTGILEALHHYHEHKFAHLDLHAGNVLVTKSKEVKIVDPQTVRTELFRTTQLLEDRLKRDVQDAMFLLRDILKSSALSPEVAVRFHETASNAISIAELRAALVAANAAPNDELELRRSGVLHPHDKPGSLPGSSDAGMVLSTALGFARSSDQIGWSQLEDHLRRELVERLHAWRAEHESSWSDDTDKAGCFSAMDKLLDLVMGRLIFALAGVYSKNPEFTDQRRVVEDLFSVPDWSSSGTRAFIEAPRALVFLLHYVHGALCLARGQPELALQLAEVAVPVRQWNATTMSLWREPDLTGGPKLLGGPTAGMWAWEYLCGMRQRRVILEQLFALPNDYDVGLAAYSMMLSLYELAMRVVELEALEDLEYTKLVVPPLFMSMKHETIATASRRTFGNRQLVQVIAQRTSTVPDALRELWPSWKRLIVEHGGTIFRRYHRLTDLPLGDLA